MSTLDLYGVSATCAIALIFLLLRRIPVYILGCALVTGGFTWAVMHQASRDPALGGLWIAALIFSSFGLLIVRVMLIRSVSLQMLGRIADGSAAGNITEDIGARLADMEYFRLILRGKENRLTAFGRFCSKVTVLFYTIFRIR